MIVQCQRCHLRHDLTGRPPGTAVSCRCGAPLQLPPSGGEAVALTCPQCGGQADKDLARCLHCESALATIRCPSCFGLAFNGNVHCPQCGGSLDAPAVVIHETGRQPLPCPRCRTDLDATVIDKKLIDSCSDCGGVWIDHAAFETMIVRRKFSDLTATLNIPGWSAQAGSLQPSEKDQLYVPCPICEQMMYRRNYARRSGIILDVCAAHGIWFDANELARVFSYRIQTSDAASMRVSEMGPAQSGPTPKIILRGSSDSNKSLGRGSGLAVLVELLASFFN